MASEAMIPADLAQSIARQTGGEIELVVPRAGGGASRQGAEVTVAWPDGRKRTGYLSYDTRVNDPKRGPFFRREAAVLKALSGDLKWAGVLAPGFIAAEPAHLALFTDLVAGSDKFASATDPKALADDFISQLAKLHAIPIEGLDLDAFGDPREPVSQVMRRQIAEWKQVNLKAAPDPVIILALSWLEANVPPDTGPAVLVHGDAGPGNFLQVDNRVTALLDWELTHYGDPVEDLAQIWVRSMFQAFRPMDEIFAAYERHSGRPVDVDRVRYHRLFFQMSFTTGGHANLYGHGQVKPAMMGVTLMFQTAHMRVIVESLAELTGQTLQPWMLPDVAPTYIDRTFEVALEDLAQSITPRLSDQHAATKAKSVARMVKLWRNRERYGRAFENAEIEDVAALTGRRAETVAQARADLAHALIAGTVDEKAALQVCFSRVSRDNALMGDAMGSLRNCYFPPLEGSTR